ncbi:MAG: dual specificity protein phosphatase family protein, partial [Anaerolineae bacterium]|nr:dual specificity protein phosphatase family protein [Anaerolineae bacterium]
MTDELPVQAVPRESPPTTLERMREWLTKRPLSVIWLRLFSQIMRRITGAPVRRYSEVTDQLVVCGQHWPHGLDEMRARGVTAVVNMRREHDDQAAGIATDRYLHLPTTDNTAPSLDHLREGVKFIKAEIEQGGKVFVHCGVG